MEQLHANDLHRRLEAGWLPLLLDVREPWELEIAHIDGSHSLPMNAIPSSLGQGVLESREREIVLICHHGVRSQQVGRYLEHSGYSQVINLVGGVDAWADQVDPSMATY
jgi:rhodanese-related sulfurtransferase